MSTGWLRGKLRGNEKVTIDNGDPVLSVKFAGREEKIYCPSPGEYRVTADVVRKAKGLGATIITCASTWCEATVEGKAYAKRLGITVMTYAQFFAYLKQRGVALRK
jgi:hypothetical protein